MKGYSRTILGLLITTVLAYTQSGWSPDIRLTYHQGYSYNPIADCHGDTIHLVWWEGYVNSIIHEEIFYMRSTDGGDTWLPDIMLSEEDDKSSVLPWITVEQEHIYVVWQQDDVGICFRKSTDSGNTWSVIDTLPNGGSGNPSICAVDSYVHVAAYNSDGRITFSSSTNYGSTWSVSQNINFSSATRPRIASNDSNALLIYLICSNFEQAVEIYFRKSTNGGINWSDSICISDDDTISSQCPAIAVDEQANIYVTWYDYKNSPYSWTGDIFLRTSGDSGDTWGSIDSLTIQHRARHSDIITNANQLHLVWDDDRHDFDENTEIYYRLSTDLGQSWESETRLTTAIGHSNDPSLACDSNYLHLFWIDMRDDSTNVFGEVYYKRKDIDQKITEKNMIVLFPSQKEFTIYPILCNKYIYVICKPMNRESANIEFISISIRDITGKEVYKCDIEQPNIHIFLEVDILSCGVYFINIQTADVCETHKVVKIH